MSSGRYRRGPVATVAAAGNSQATAETLTGEINKVTGADGTKGVILRQGFAGGPPIIVVNGEAAENLKIYPADGGAIDALGADAAFTLSGGQVLVLYPHSATQWYSVGAISGVSSAELGVLDGVTTGTAAASKALVLDADKAIDSFRMTGKLFTTQPDPETAADTATLAAAQMLSGILVATPTNAAAYTTLTGAQLETAVLAIHPALANGDTFDLTIINIGGTGDDITLTAGASGITIVGDAVVRPSADSGTEQAGQGTFRFRRTAADTFIVYRVS